MKHTASDHWFCWLKISSLKWIYFYVKNCFVFLLADFKCSHALFQNSSNKHQEQCKMLRNIFLEQCHASFCVSGPGSDKESVVDVKIVEDYAVKINMPQLETSNNEGKLGCVLGEKLNSLLKNIFHVSLYQSNYANLIKWDGNIKYKRAHQKRKTDSYRSAMQFFKNYFLFLVKSSRTT